MSKILMVEDDQLYGQEVAAALGGAGFEVYWAKNLQETWQALEGQEINAVFLDLMLDEKMDGFEILYGMKNDERYKHIQVIILTKIGDMKEIDRAMSMGAVDYLVKSNVSYERIVTIAKNRTGQACDLLDIYPGAAEK